jgi:hypothetical protein
MPFDEARALHMVAAPGELNDVVVKADPADPSTGWPLTVTVTDAGASFAAAPQGSDQPCEIVDPHTARCTAPAGMWFTQAVVELGDGDDHLRFAPGSTPLREQFIAGDGNDVIATGPFVGDRSFRYASDTGAGDDIVHIATPVNGLISFAPVNGASRPDGLALRTGAGADKVVAANGALDSVSCGDDADVLIADPWDVDTVYVEDPGSCETRVSPRLP